MKALIVSLIVCFSFVGKSQSLDSVYVAFASNQQELVVYVEGEFPWVNDLSAIHQIISGASSDSVYIDIHFMPCQMLPMFTSYDTTFYVPMNLNSGNWTVVLHSIMDTNLDSNSSYFNPHTSIIDTAYFNLEISLSEEEKCPPSVEFYPNPTSGILKLEIGEGISILKCRIISLSGAHKDLSWDSHLNVKIDNVPNGVYLLEITTSKGVIRQQVILLN